MTSSRFGRLPEGVRDLLPADARRKRQMEQAFADVAGSWGYQEVITPTFEYFENLSSGDSDDDKLYKFLDRRGHLMALKPDVTRPIARLVATRMRNAPLPLRLYYLSHAFNYEEPLVGRQREYYQAGVEILGAAGPAADAEAVALAVEAMQSCGLQEFRMSLGDVSIFHSLMEELQLSELQVQAIKGAVGKKDFVLLEEQLSSTGISQEKQRRISKLLSLRGGPQVLDQAREILDSERALAALENLGQVYGTLKSYGVQEAVTLDLGLLLGLDYYTGVVFEGYTLSLGFPVCGGGRYDKLLEHFGYPLPATGFALSLDQLLAVKEKEQDRSEEALVDVLVAWGENRLDEAVRKAQELRAQGLKVELQLEPGTPDEAKDYAINNKIKRLVYINTGDVQDELLT
ncbi:ATP phosphoribosyltransferase regulatory subunit [Desulfofalx alkaliphila]|uniref:ATP phosphoribosyltransferase regulatory subunit n=1 Tax=Desulfofalx alkaliphila TaxID=105483 RepID=UPI0004E2179E|nr:ATP phosphoribosyltransferase regulatory subunit [Desulfofalx alkaliphila]